MSSTEFLELGLEFALILGIIGGMTLGWRAGGWVLALIDWVKGRGD